MKDETEFERKQRRATVIYAATALVLLVIGAIGISILVMGAR